MYRWDKSAGSVAHTFMCVKVADSLDFLLIELQCQLKQLQITNRHQSPIDHWDKNGENQTDLFCVNYLKSFKLVAITISRTGKS